MLARDALRATAFSGGYCIEHAAMLIMPDDQVLARIGHIRLGQHECARRSKRQGKDTLDSARQRRTTSELYDQCVVTLVQPGVVGKLLELERPARNQCIHRTDAVTQFAELTCWWTTLRRAPCRCALERPRDIDGVIDF